MTTVVDVLNRIARHCSITAPSSWITATADEYLELRDDFLRETVNDLLDRVDWPQPIAGQVTIAGTGVASYALPVAFRRLQRHPYSVYDERLDAPGIPVSTDGEWVELLDSGIAGADRFYRLKGYDGAFEIEFEGAVATGDDIILSYVTNNWMATSGGVVGSMLTAETDVLVLPDRLVEVGTIWRWRERKGLPFQDKYTEFNMLLGRYLNDIRGRRVVSFKRRKPQRWQDRVPAFIPSA
ncbi:MAG: hypothetical protein ACRC14_02715 [Paracoccaceae bacterium]